MPVRRAIDRGPRQRKVPRSQPPSAGDEGALPGSPVGSPVRTTSPIGLPGPILEADSNSPSIKGPTSFVATVVENVYEAVQDGVEAVQDSVEYVRDSIEDASEEVYEAGRKLTRTITEKITGEDDIDFDWEPPDVDLDAVELLEAYEEPEGGVLVKEEVEFIRWDHRSFHDRKSKVVYVKDCHERDVPPMMDKTAMNAARKLHLHKHLVEMQDWTKGVKAVIALVGDDEGVNEYMRQEQDQPPLPEGIDTEEAYVRMRLLFGRGLAAAALETHSVIITSGLDVGMGAFMGKSNRDRYHTLPLVGVVGKGNVTWPGDDRGAPRIEERMPLQPDHTHVVMLDNYQEDYECTWQFRIELCKAIANGYCNYNQYLKDLKKWRTNGKAPTDKEPEDEEQSEDEMTDAERTGGAPKGKPKLKTLPRAGFVINGGSVALMEAVNLVRMGWPLCIVAGSGGLADAIADALADPNLDELIPDPYILEIIKDGILETVSLKQVDGAMMRSLVERLFGTPGSGGLNNKDLELAWQLIAVYDATRQEAIIGADFLRISFYLMTVALTTVVMCLWVAGSGFDILSKQSMIALQSLALVLPIAISVIMAIDNRFQPMNKAKILSAAKELLTSEIYRFRSGCGDYMGVATEMRNDLFAAKMNSIRNNVIASSVGERSLNHEAAESMMAKNYVVSAEDDGMSAVGPDQYVRLRVYPLEVWYNTQCYINNRKYAVMQSSYIWLVVGGVLIAAAPFYANSSEMPMHAQALVAVTVIMYTALRAYIEEMGYQSKLGAYNRAVYELRNTIAWFRALNPVEKANPQSYHELVKRVELIKFYELQATNPGAAAISTDERVSASDGLDIPTLIHDIRENITKGKIQFDKTWIHKHPLFFDDYNEWLVDKMRPALEAEILSEQAVKEAGAIIPVGGGERDFLQEKPMGQERLPAYPGIPIHDEHGRLKNINWDPYDFVERITHIVPVPSIKIAHQEIIDRLQLQEWMQIHQGWSKGPKGMIIVVGGDDYVNQFIGQEKGVEPLPSGLTAEQIQFRLQLLFSRGVVKAGIDTRSVVLSSGMHHGVSEMIGLGNRDRRYKLPLVGVVGKGLMTWPGDNRQMPDSRREKLIRMDPNHTHYCMLDTRQDLPGVRRYLYELAMEFLRQVPAVVIVVNGQEQELLEILKFVRVGVPVVTIKGTGGAADAIVSGIKKSKDAFVPNSRILEAVKEGIIEQVDLADVDGGLTHQMIVRLLGGGAKLETMAESLFENTKIGWEMVALFECTSREYSFYGGFVTIVDLCMGIVLTALCVAYEMVCSMSYDDFFLSPCKEYSFGLVVLPVVIILVALIDVDFRFIAKRNFLWGAAEAIKSELYMYRSGMGDYAQVSEALKDDLLMEKILDTTTTLVTTMVSEVSLNQAWLRPARDRNFRVSEDDDGLAILSPELYMKVRLRACIKDYKSASTSYATNMARMQLLVYTLGGLGAVLATIKYYIWIALPNIIATATLSFMARNNYTDKLSFYNRALSELENLLAFWEALSPIEQANPQRYAQVVLAVEGIKKAEIKTINPSASSGRGGGSGEVNGLSLEQLRQDMMDNQRKDTTIRFKNSWVEKHAVFFDQYEFWLMKQGFKNFVLERERKKFSETQKVNDIKEEVQNYHERTDEVIEGFLAKAGKFSDDSKREAARTMLEKMLHEARTVGIKSPIVGLTTPADVGIDVNNFPPREAWSRYSQRPTTSNDAVREGRKRDEQEPIFRIDRGDIHGDEEDEVLDLSEPTDTR